MQPIKTQDCYIPVDVKERLPTKKGWYNLFCNGSPEPCGRAYFSGEKFSFTSSSAVSGLLESGKTLYWLEKRSGVIIFDVEEFNKVIGDAMDKAAEIITDPSGTPYLQYKTEYINQLIKEV